jgi:hypothetical protein
MGERNSGEEGVGGVLWDRPFLTTVFTMQFPEDLRGKRHRGVCDNVVERE